VEDEPVFAMMFGNFRAKRLNSVTRADEVSVCVRNYAYHK
jgi:hypothetical protein